jgi:hypothetical protein
MTPPLDETGFGTLIVPDVGGVEQALWIRSAGHDVPFAMSATDFEGKKVDLTTSLIWVNSDDAADYTAGGTIQSVEAAYSSAGNVTRRTADLKGGLVAFAPSDGGKPGSTSHHADALEFDGAVPDPSGPFPTFTPAWHPVVHYLTLRVPAAEQVVGGELPGMPPVFKYAQPYLDNGFQAGKPPVFLVLKSGSNSPGLKFPANNSGGMATPNFSIDGLSRDQGPVADALNLLGGTFDPKTFFQGLGAKVLGAIDLADIIAQALGSDIATKAPKIQSMPVYPNDDKSKPPTALDTTVDWTPDVRKDPLGFFEPKAAKDKTLSIHVKIHTPVADPSKTATTIEGQLVDFNLNLFGLDADGGLTFIIIHFKKVHFSAKTGAKANVDVDIDTVTFAGPLTFINELEQLLASLGGPSIDVQPSGVTASYSLPLPSIGVGVFAIENISLGGSVTIPFDGTPVRLRVNFCTRENPFLLSISLFAGGGFFGIGLGADGIELIEVSLEFGASVSLDLGVASGGVSIMAGIYFKLSSNPSPPPSDIVQLTGFLQASGNLEVLGIISISIVFYLGFTYLDPGKCYGTASVTVTVKVLFFSASVSMTVTKTFGGGGDPAFAQAISQADWDNYCDAFV